MRKVISKWINVRLRQTVDMSPETFGPQVANGRIIAQLLHNYEIIKSKELDLITETSQVSECLKNFKLINSWLSRINLALPKEDIDAIVRGFDTACLHLFYKLFLKLKDKETLYYLTRPDFIAQLGRPLRETRHSIEIEPIHFDTSEINFLTVGLCNYFSDEDNSKEHWQSYSSKIIDEGSNQSGIFTSSLKSSKSVTDANDILQVHVDSKTEDSKESMANQKTMSISSSSASKSITEVNYEDDTDLDHRTYQELIDLQEEARNMPKFVPDLEEAERMLKKICETNKIRRKSKMKSYLDILRGNNDKNKVTCEGKGDNSKTKLTHKRKSTIKSNMDKEDNRKSQLRGKSKVESEDKEDGLITNKSTMKSKSEEKESSKTKLDIYKTNGEEDINETQVESKDQIMINILTKQSLYQKQLVAEYGQAKMESEYLKEKIRQSERRKFRKILNQVKEPSNEEI
ncbi:unnamed protein product [Ceutorhynchus assimilis]|uniref:Calponin-homology (CH) domain-containing protein n=1 Tax=Ceutorhynchus assimilis TaxID=467358 RepID=A0A9N9MDN6_9CUCU|nr:unnamed protein product [Ceutorhynchus assimilis]